MEGGGESSQVHYQTACRKAAPPMRWYKRGVGESLSMHHFVSRVRVLSRHDSPTSQLLTENQCFYSRDNGHFPLLVMLHKMTLGSRWVTCRLFAVKFLSFFKASKLVFNLQERRFRSGNRHWPRRTSRRCAGPHGPSSSPAARRRRTRRSSGRSASASCTCWPSSPTRSRS